MTATRTMYDSGDQSAPNGDSHNHRETSPSAAAAPAASGVKRASAVSASAKASLGRNKELSARIADLLKLLLRTRESDAAVVAATTALAGGGGGGGGGGATLTVTAPVAPEEVRPVLDAIRDYCVAANNRTKMEGGAARSAELHNDDDLNGFLAVTFLSTLFFANETEDMLRDSLESAIDRLRAAQAFGQEDAFHNAVVEAVNNILLFTPLTAPPVWLLANVKRTIAEHQTPKRRRGKDSSSASGGVEAPVASRRASVVANASAETMLEDMAAVARAMLYRMDQEQQQQQPTTSDDGDHDHDNSNDNDDGASDACDKKAASPDPVSDADGEEDDEGMILEDDCLDYLNAESGASLLHEDHWLEVWLATMVEGYVHLAASAMEEEGLAAATKTEGDKNKDDEGETHDEDEDEGAAAISASIPTLLPRPVWRSTANNAYAQFAVQLLVIFYSRGSDGSLNYCARVHKLTQYYGLRLRGNKHGCAPIPCKNAPRPAAPPAPPVKAPRRPREVSVVTDTSEETQTLKPETPEPEPAPVAVPAVVAPRMVVRARPAPTDADEAGRGSKHVVVFHPSSQRSARRGDRDAAAPIVAATTAEPESTMVEPLTGGYSRFHRCVKPSDFKGKQRVLVPEEAAEAAVVEEKEAEAEAEAPAAAAAGPEEPEKEKEKKEEQEEDDSMDEL